MQGGTNPTQVSLVLDPRSIDALVERINIAFTEAFTKANKVASAQMAQMSKDVTDSVKHITTAVNNSESAFVNLGKKGKVALHPMSQEALALVDALQAVAKSSGEVIAAVQKSSVQQRRASVETTNQLDNAARLEIANVRNVGIQTNIEGQKAVVVARGAAKSRVLITQGMVRSIILLEKGIGATISGVAKTAVSSVSKIFGGLTGLFKKDTTGISAQLRETNAAIARGVKQGNTELTTGVRGSLSKREELLRSSFRTQESIVRGSALRQQETLAGLRKGTQTGVLGAANRGLNIGSLIGGFAVIQAARSTFKVGSEFVRGLAVLQAQLGLTEEQMKGVDALSVQLGNDISLPGVSALDAAQAIQILSKQFGSLGDGAIVAAENAAKGTLQLSRAVGASAEDTAGIIGAAVNVFGISADKAITVADAVAGAMTQAAGVSFEDFKTAFIQGATVFENFVGPAESANDVLLDFNTSLAVLAKSGLVGESAGAGLKQFFLSASKQSDKALALQDDLAKRAGTTGRIFFDAAHKARPFAESLDLLRKSLRGMSDEQRTATLTTLFGVRAQTIATALIRESGDDYDAIRERISKQGLAAKIAAAQNTGFAGALDALKSVVETLQIQLFKKLNPALGVVTLGIATLANNIFSGTGAFAILRRALLGVAIGMGAIIAAKGAVEVIKLLGVAAKLALTPFGAVLVAAGLLGAAISILADRSEPFRKALGDLVDRLKGLGTAALGLVSKGLSALGGVIERDVMPFLITMVNFLSDHVVGAFDAVSRFITDKAIPAIKSAAEFIGKIASIGFRAVVDFIHDHAIPAFKAFADFVVTTVVPVAIHVGEIFKGAFDTALEAVKGFWHTVEPILRPALEGFKTLGRAIAAIFTGGDFSQLGKGFSAVGSGISTSFSTIGKNLLGVLDRLWETLQAWFKEHFTGTKLIDLGKGFLDLVEFIGNTLGKIVTSPTFVRAVALLAAGLAAAAVLVAGRFIEGFGKAFIDHLPGLFKLLGKAILDGMVAIFHNPLIATGIALAIFAIFNVVNMVKSFRAAGTKAGGGFTGGFKASIKGLKNETNFLTSFFGGPERVARTYASGVSKALSKEMTGLATKIRALGGRGISGLGEEGFIGPIRPVQGMRSELLKLTKGLDAATIKGLLMRDAFKQIGGGVVNSFKALGQGIIGGVKGIVKGVGAALSATNAYNGPATSGGKAFSAAFGASLKGSGGAISAAFSSIGVGIKAAAVAQGTSVGKLIGGALAKAAIGAVAAVAGFQAGKAEGASGGSGIMAALLTGITAGSLTGSPIIGVIAAGATLIGAAFGKAQAKAKAFKEEVQNLAGSFKDDLVNAIKSGQIAVDNLDFNHIINLPGVDTQVSNQILDDLKKNNALSAFDQAGLTIPVDVIPLIKTSGGDVEKFGRDFQKRLFEAVSNEAEFKRLFGAGIAAVDVQGVLSRATLSGSDAQKKFANDVLHTQNAILGANSAAVEAAKVSAEEARVTGVVDKAERDLALHRQTSAGKPDPFANLVQGVQAAIPLLKKAQGESAKFALAEAQIGKTAEEIQADLIKVHLPPLPQTIIDQWTNGLDEARSHAEELQKAVDKIPESISAIGRNAVATPGQLVQDAAVIQVKADTSGFVAAVTDSVNHDFDTPEVRTALAQLGDGVSAAISTAITSGDIKNNPQLLTFIQPLLDAALAGANTDEEKTRIQQLFADIFAGVSIELPADVAKVGAAKFAADVNQFLIDNPFTATINAEFNVAHKNDPNFLQGHGLTPDFNPTATGGLLAGILPTAGETKAAMLPVGAAGLLGVGAGFHDPEARKVVKAQVDSAMHDIVEWAKRKVGARSPSTVMAEVGGFMAQGLANGITAGSTAAATAAEAAAQAAVDAAKGVINGNPITPITIPTSAQVPPQANIISGAEHDRLNALKVGRTVTTGAQLGTPAGMTEMGQWIASLAHFGSMIKPDDPSLPLQSDKQELSDLVVLARALVTTAEQMNKRGPDVTNVAITEAKDARSTARATIAELRADRMLLKGVR